MGTVHTWFEYLDFVCFRLLLFYAIPTVFQLHHGVDMMYEMRIRKPEPTLLPAQGVFNLPHHFAASVDMTLDVTRM